MNDDILKHVADNPAEQKALHQHFIETFDVWKFLRKSSPQATNEILGERMRACHQAIELLEEGFKRLETYKTIPTKLKEELPR